MISQPPTECPGIAGGARAWIATLILAASALHRVTAASPGTDRPPIHQSINPLIQPLVAAPGKTGAEREGQELAAELRAQRPNEDFSTSGVLLTRDDNTGKRKRIPVRLHVRVRDAEWESIYEALTTNGVVFEKLIVVHRLDQPNQYLYTRGADDHPPGATLTLTGAQANLGFAGTDFWLSDLGLEFFHWPEQALVRKEMKSGRSCRVLEGVNPQPGDGGYARVLSWIDFEYRSLLRAEAFDAHRKLLKLFWLGDFKKVKGRWELKSMKILNDQSNTLTTLQFDLQVK